MQKCSRSWPHMMWKLSPRSSLWPTNAPEPPRVVHGTWPHKLELPSRVAWGPSSGTERRKRRRTATTRSRGPPLWCSRQRPEARATTTNARDRRRVAAVHALCTFMVATMPRSISEQREQSSKDGSPLRCHLSKEKVDDGEVAAAEWDLGFQSPVGDLKDIFAGGSYSGEDN
jgi:hypothetical protein